ncbi:unnamed protein product [Pseudo-nitzschia multistriata]|uniref:Uncharacterized protein n=1 Tax=Pseudo-nitzschia multistriata TaxID=183589 RepID=A0A448ZLY6_9STRA|nr:unnamed protein product [Pseudo-nitzschia multistriata]
MASPRCSSFAFETGFPGSPHSITSNHGSNGPSEITARSLARSCGLLSATLWIGYTLGASKAPPTAPVLSSDLNVLASLRVLADRFEEWIQWIVVPLYLLGTVTYLSVRTYNDTDWTLVLSSTKTSEKKFRYSLLPSLRMASTETIPEEPEEEGLKEETTTPLSVTPLPSQKYDKPAPIDMNGTFKVVENHNFAEFLNAQGLPWFLCKAASKARPTHTFSLPTYSDLTITIKGIIESETHYTIDGPCTETTIRGRVFRDSVNYLYEESDEGENDGVCVGLRTTKVSVGEGYAVHVQRRIVPAGATYAPPKGQHAYDLGTPADVDRLLMTNTLVYDEPAKGGSGVVASQLFHRQ